MPTEKAEWFGPRLRHLRQRAHLTQAELGRRVGLDGPAIRKLEANVSQPLLATALEIAEALGVPLTEFLPQGKARRRQRIPLAELVEGITEQNRHPEIKTGPPVGKEVW